MGRSLFFMYLKNRPWKFQKDGVVVSANYTAEARDLVQTGWERVTDKPQAAPVKAPEPKESDLETMTRPELMKALDGAKVEYKSNASKAELLKLCQEYVDG